MSCACPTPIACMKAYRCLQVHGPLSDRVRNGMVSPEFAERMEKTMGKVIVTDRCACGKRPEGVCTPLSCADPFNPGRSVGKCKCGQRYSTDCPEQPGMPCPYDPDRKMDGGAVNIVDPKTGGAKGQKLARFDMIPAEVQWALAEHYGKGEAKYPSDETGLPNWMRGYRWSLSASAHDRHMNLFYQGEDIDPETGSSHLICAMWHLYALEWFRLKGVGTNDLLGWRPVTRLNEGETA